MADFINKILGAVALSGRDGAVTRIPSNILQSGDCCLCIMQDVYYVFKAYEQASAVSPVNPSTGTYDSTYLPLIIKPEDDPTTSWRWHLVSPSSILTDIKVSSGKKLLTSTIQGQDGIQLLNGAGTKVAEILADGSLWVNKLVLNDTSLVSGLRAEYIGNISESMIVTRDGTRSFIAPVSGREPILPDHLTTKNYVDEKVQVLHPELYMRKDGSTSFENPVSGFDPNLDDHLATKRYVDKTLETAINDMLSAQNFIIYKCGITSIPVGARRIQVTFGGVLKSYVVFPSVTNTVDTNPYSTTAVVSDQYQTYFTVDLGGEIPTSNYKLNWMIVGLPLTTEYPDDGTPGVDPGEPSIPTVTSGKYILKDNTNVYISNLGNDSNDGFTVNSAKKTNAGLMTLLNGLDPNGYIVTVNINGLIENDALWFLPDYYPENLIFKGKTSEDVDGFTGNIVVCSGGLTTHNIQFKKLSVRSGVVVECNDDLKITNTANTSAIDVAGLLQLTGSNLIYEGKFSEVFNITKGQVYAKNCIFTSKNSTLVNFAKITGPNSSLHFENTATYDGQVTISGKSIVMNQGGMVYGLTTSCPGNGTINVANPFIANEIPAKWSHASQHMATGNDPISPADINALPVDGIAVSAKKLETEQSIIISGIVSGTGKFDGTKPCLINASLNTNDATISGLLAHVNTSFSSTAPSVPHPHDARVEAIANKIIMRNGDSRAQIGYPSVDNDIANKKYVDDKIAKGVDKLTTPRKIEIGKQLKGSENFDGDSDIVIDVDIVGGPEGTFPRSTGRGSEVGQVGINYEYLVKTLYIVENTEELNNCKVNLVPNYAAMFNNWKKLAAAKVSNGTVIDETVAWAYNSASNYFYNTTNSVGDIACITPEIFDDYILEATLKSTNNDDDSIGLCLAHFIDATGYNNMLLAYRSPGGNQCFSIMDVKFKNEVLTQNTFIRTGLINNTQGNSIFRWLNGCYGSTAADAVWLNKAKTQRSSNYPNAPYTPSWDPNERTTSGFITNRITYQEGTGAISNNLWGNLASLGVKMKASRVNNIITVESTDILNLPNSSSYLPAATINLNTGIVTNPNGNFSNSLLQKYKIPCNIGFAAYSQSNSSWNDIKLESSNMYILDSSSNKVWALSNKIWYIVGENIFDYIPIGTFCSNPFTGKMFFRTQSGLQKVAG